MSLVSASPLGRFSLERRDGDDFVVWTTVTLAYTVYQPRRVTKTVTVHHSLVDSQQRLAPGTPPPTVESPAHAPASPVPVAPVAHPPAPAPTTVATVESPTSAPVVSDSTVESSTGSTVFSGQGTFYSAGLGSCGITNTDADFICAISHELYDSLPNGGNPNNSPFCGRKLKASRGGKSVTVTVVDRCPGCAKNDIDFSPTAFDTIGLESEGRVDIIWQWIS